MKQTAPYARRQKQAPTTRGTVLLTLAGSQPVRVGVRHKNEEENHSQPHNGSGCLSGPVRTLA